MLTLHELFPLHEEAREKYAKLFAASQAVGARLHEAMRVQTAIRQQIHALVGVIPNKTLVQTISGSRFYEIQSSLSHPHLGSYRGIPVYRNNGSKKRDNLDRDNGKHLQSGSVIPVPATHPIYLKWQQQRLREKLEGKD